MKTRTKLLSLLLCTAMLLPLFACSGGSPPARPLQRIPPPRCVLCARRFRRSRGLSRQRYHHDRQLLRRRRHRPERPRLWRRHRQGSGRATSPSPTCPAAPAAWASPSWPTARPTATPSAWPPWPRWPWSPLSAGRDLYPPTASKYLCAFGQYGYGIVVAKSPYQTLDDLIEAAKESPISFGATGYPQPLTMKDLGAETGAQFSFVQYPSTTDCVADVLGGFVPCALGDMASLRRLCEERRHALLASAHSQRWDVAPEVETLQEMGYDAVCDSYMGLCVPADTPDEIVEVLRDACATAFEDPAFQEIMTNTNQAPAYMTGDEYEALVREYYELYSTVDFESAG